MIRTILVASLLLLMPASCEQAVVEPQPSKPNPIKKLVNDLVSADWETVVAAKSELESRQAESIPALMELLDRDERVELENTADLIYPGAKKFYGHGWVLDYDVDWISVRAGWALEELTFQDFGFREGAINEADLLKAVINRQQNVHLTDRSKTAEMKKQARAIAVSRAKTWWQTTGQSWNRFNALLDALRSDNPNRQGGALGWVRYGKTKCDGLTLESFNKYILPEAKRLANSTDESVRVQAKHLVKDKEGWWLKYKTESK